MTPKKIALLTDSSADLRWDQARENNIFFVPLRILCQDGEYLDGVDIRGQDIYRRLRSFITASCPRPPCPVWRTSARSSGRSLIWDMTA